MIRLHRPLWMNSNSTRGIPYGTVPYFKTQARWYRSQARMMVLLGVANTALIVTARFWEFKAVQSVMLFYFGAQWARYRGRATAYDKEAWQVEVSETMTGMATSGIYSLDEAFEVVQAMPPPDMEPEEWREVGERMREAVRKRLGDDG